MIYLILFLYLINNFLILKLNFHIFQQNYYMPDTQIKWLFKNIWKFGCLLIINGIQIYLVIKNNPLSLIICLGLMLINMYIVIEKNVIKKIVYTNRIIMMYLTNYLVLGILFLIFKNNMMNYLVAIFIINSISTIYMILINYSNQPINKIINNYYINDAKKILNSMPNLKIIAITGSYGKTSTKNYLTTLLSTKYNVLMTPGNFNTLLGITRTVRENLRPIHDVFVCEVGIDRVGQMDKIIKLIKPDACIITAIGQQHLKTFVTQENIINSKMKLLDGLKNDGVAFLNLDSELINTYKTKKTVIGYGINNNKNNKIKIDSISYFARGLKFNLIKNKEKYEVNTQILGEHNLINLYGAISVADYLNVPLKDILNEVKKIENVEHRLKLIPGSSYTIIDDAYNSNPIGAKNALKTLKEFDGWRILITPGMIELGTKQEEYNYEFGKLAASCADFIYLIEGPCDEIINRALLDAKYEAKKIKICKSFKEAFSLVEKQTTSKHKYVLIENDLPDNYK